MTHHAHDVDAPVDDLLVEGGCRLQGCDLSLPELGLQVLPVLLRVDDSHGEVETLLPGYFPHDIRGPLEVQVPSCGARRADDQGYLRLAGGQQHQPDVPFYGGRGEVALARGQGVGAAVGGAGIGGDEVGLPLHGPLKGGLGVAGAQHSRG